MLHDHLDKVENAQLMHWKNTSEASVEYTKSYTSQLIVTTGKEFSAGASLSAAFQGIGVTVDASTKTFSSKETTSSETKEIKIDVPANSEIWFYQRKYVLSTDMTFINDAWGSLWNAGSEGGYHIQHGKVVSEIWAEDYITTSTKLEGSQNKSFTSLTAAGLLAGSTRQFGNLTEKARKTLKGMGIDGSQKD